METSPTPAESFLTRIQRFGEFMVHAFSLMGGDGITPFPLAYCAEPGPQEPLDRLTTPDQSWR